MEPRLSAPVPIRAEAIDAVIFDLDGVVTDTAGLHETAWKEMFDALLERRADGGAYEPFSQDDYLTYVDGKPRMDGLRSFLAARHIHCPEGHPEDGGDAETLHGLAARKNAAYVKALHRDGAQVFSSTVSLVRRLQDEGYGTAVVSASKNLDAVLAAAGLDNLFSTRVGGVVSAELGLRGKPAPDIFIEAAKRLGVAPARCAVVEDAVSGVEAGRNGGFGQVIGVDRHGDGAALHAAGADSVVTDLGQVEVASRGGHTGRPPDATHHIDDIVARGPLMLFLDYDGTLTPIVARPELAVLSERGRDAVRRLAKQIPVAVVSGRDREAVAELVGVEGVLYAGSHGMDMEGVEAPPELAAAVPMLDRAEGMLRRRLADVPGAIVERKRFSVAAHYRMVDADRVQDVAAAVDEAVASDAGLRKGEGKKVFEVRPDVPWDKGTAVQHLSQVMATPGGVPVFIGDDVTDEDAFTALRRDGIGIAVLDHVRPTAARYSLTDPDAVHDFLDRLAQRLEEDA